MSSGNSAVNDHYQDFYSASDSRLLEWRRINAVTKARNIIEFCSGIKHDSVIDIGAGDGAVLRELGAQKFAREFYAAEISASGVEIIKSQPIAGLQSVRQFDGYALPYEDKQFDLAFMSHVLEHVDHPRQLLAEAIRVARFLYVEVPLELTCRLPLNFVWTNVGHINFYCQKSFRQLIQSSSLNVIHQKTINASPEAHIFASPRFGRAKWLFRESMMKAIPGAARFFLVYHSGILCTEKELPVS